MKTTKNLLGLLTFLFIFINNSVIAQTSNNNFLTPAKCNWNQIKNHRNHNKSLFRQTSKFTQEAGSYDLKMSQTNVSVPSLWWAREQFDPFRGRLINNWLALPQTKQINLVVNWQLWTLLDYLARYRLINQFGTVARQYGYELRIFNQQKQCLATYQYNSDSNPPKWDIHLEQSNQDSLQVEPKTN